MADTTYEGNNWWTPARLDQAHEFIASYIRAGEKVYRAGVLCHSVEDFAAWAKTGEEQHGIEYHSKTVAATLEGRGFLIFLPLFAPEDALNGVINPVARNGIAVTLPYFRFNALGAALSFRLGLSQVTGTLAARMMFPNADITPLEDVIAAAKINFRFPASRIR